MQQRNPVSGSEKLNSMQRAFMNDLVTRYGADEKTVCTLYALAERRGEILRRKNTHGITPEQYARALWKDGINKGWLLIGVRIRSHSRNGSIPLCPPGGGCFQNHVRSKGHLKKLHDHQLQASGFRKPPLTSARTFKRLV
jgi:hypothetical protein